MAYSPETFLRIARTQGIEAARAYKVRSSAPAPRPPTPQGSFIPPPAPAPVQQAAKKISQTFTRPPTPQQSFIPPPAPRPVAPAAVTGAGTAPTPPLPQTLQQNLQQSGGITGTLGLQNIQKTGYETGLQSVNRGLLGGLERTALSIGSTIGALPAAAFASITNGAPFAQNFYAAREQFMQQANTRFQEGDPSGPIQYGRGPTEAFGRPTPNIIQGTGPSPIQLGNPAQTLGDISPLFPEGTVIGRAGGTTAAQLPDGTIVDLTRVETYGQLAAESLFRWMDTGNPDMRPTNIREEWAMSFRHLWEDNYDNVSDFLRAMGYRQIPGTNNWIRENPMDLTSPSSGAGGTGAGSSRVIQGPRTSSAGFGGSVARSNRSSFGLTQWGITPGA